MGIGGWQTPTEARRRVNTCALCGGEIAFGRFGLCQNCFKEWTCTGSYPVPDWLKIFTREHNNLERHKHNGEVPFPEDYEPVYVEVRYGVIEQQYHKTERRGRKHKIINPRKKVVPTMRDGGTP